MIRNEVENFKKLVDEILNYRQDKQIKKILIKVDNSYLPPYIPRTLEYMGNVARVCMEKYPTFSLMRGRVTPTLTLLPRGKYKTDEILSELRQIKGVVFAIPL